MASRTPRRQAPRKAKRSGESRKSAVYALALPLGELSPKVTERASGAGYPLRRLIAASSPIGRAKGAARRCIVGRLGRCRANVMQLREAQKNPFPGRCRDRQHLGKRVFLRQHRFMGQGDSARNFDTSESMKNAGILDVFSIFHTARLGQKIRRSLQLPSSGVALLFQPLFQGGCA